MAIYKRVSSYPIICYSSSIIISYNVRLAATLQFRELKSEQHIWSILHAAIRERERRKRECW